MSRLIPVGRPEAGAVRRQHLVADDQFSILVQTELELGVCDDDSAGKGIIRAFFIKRQGAVAQFCRIFLSLSREIFLKMGNALLIGNILVVVADFGLGGRCVDWLRQLIGFLQSFRQPYPAYRAVLLVACPAAAGDVAPHDALNRQHLKLFAHHAVAVILRLAEKFRHIFHIYGNHMVWQDVLGHVEPEFGHLGKDSSFLCHFIF